MSHQPERKEKDCLNCGADVQGRFCHVCGQENIVPHQNFWALTKHFIYDIFHFDGKFFDTLKNMFFKPGIVPKEYVQGKRTKYLDPIRMYLFVSAVFFLYFFSLAKNSEIKETDDELYIPSQGRVDLANSFKEELKANPADTILLKKIILLSDTSKPIKFSDLAAVDPPSVEVNNRKYKSVAEYESSQQMLPPDKRDGWFLRKLIVKVISINTKYRESWERGVNDFTKSLLHLMPYMLFVSLPFFALILKLLYARRKRFFYSDHAVFTLYHFILSFLVLLLIFIFYDLQKWLHWDLFDYLILFAVIFWLFYLYKSMRRFYEQSRLTTMVKFLLLNLLGLFTILLLLVIFVFFSIFQL